MLTQKPVPDVGMCVPAEALVRRMNHISVSSTKYNSVVDTNVLQYTLYQFCVFQAVWRCFVCNSALSSYQGTLPGEGSADSWFQTRQQNWPKFYTTSRWPTRSSSCTGRLTTSTCGWGPSPSPLCLAAASARFWLVCCPDSLGL